MSRDIVDRSLRTCWTLASWLVDPVGVDAVFGDGLSVGGEDPDVAVVDEHEDVLSSVGSSDAEVAEFPGVAQGHFAGLVDPVASDAELAGVADRCCRGFGFDAGVVRGAVMNPRRVRIRQTLETEHGAIPPWALVRCVWIVSGPASTPNSVSCFRIATISSSTASGTRVGDRCGRLERATRPVSPSAR